MKRFLIYLLVTVTFAVGVASTTVGRNEAVSLVASSTDETHHELSATDMLVSVGMVNPQIRLTHSYVSFRLISSFSNSLRISSLTQAIHQQFFTGYAVFLLKSAHKQLDGYYLYHLCKLLI